MGKQFYIDKRPLPILFLIEYRNAFILLFSFVLFFAFIFSKNIPQGLSEQAYHAIVIFFFAVFLWSTNIIPLPITSLMVMGLLATFNVLETGKIYSFFGNSSLFFIIGAFIISAGLSASGLSARAAYYVLTRFGDKPYKLVLSIFLLAAFMSHIMPEHAVAALLFPILISMTKKMSLPSNSVLGKYMFFSLAWGAVLGGVVTFLGGARNPLAIGIMMDTMGDTIGFLEWMAAVAPPTYVMMGIVALYIKKEMRRSMQDMSLPDKILIVQREHMGKLSFREVKALLIFIITIYMWIFQSSRFGIANIALISASLFFVLNVISWEDAKKEINWGPILMYGGAIALGRSLEETGLLEFITANYLSNTGFTTITFILIVFCISLFLTEGISNAAVVIILLPVVMEIALQLGFTAKLAVYLVAVPSGLAFMFPMGSPPNAIAFTSGYIQLGEAIKKGFMLNVAAVIVFLIFALLYWPYIGVY